MGEGKENDFWESSNDDFWSKPVVSEDWLKTDTGAGGGEDFFQEKEPEQVTEQKKEQKKEQQQEPEQSPAAQAVFENPYANPYWSPISSGKEVSGKPSEQQEKPKRKETKRKETKRVPVHTIICLVFIALAICSVASAVIAAKQVKARSIKEAKELSYRETRVDSVFEQYGNNRVFLGEDAVTVWEDFSMGGSKEGNMLVAVYVEVESSEYVDGDSFALHDIYIGYDKDGGREYRIPARSEAVYPYVSSLGFSRESLLGAYGCGNGSDTAGYFFFMVPEGTKEITFYSEEREQRKNNSFLKEVFYKEMKVLPRDEDLLRDLTEREREEW